MWLLGAATSVTDSLGTEYVFIVASVIFVMILFFLGGCLFFDLFALLLWTHLRTLGGKF